MIGGGGERIIVKITDCESGVNEYIFCSVNRVIQCLGQQIQKILNGRNSSVVVVRQQPEKIEDKQEKEEEGSEVEHVCSYDVELLRQQLLLFDRDLDISNFIETQKILAQNCIQQLTDLAFYLIKLSKQLLTIRKPLPDFTFKQQNITMEKLDKIQTDCMGVLLRVKEQRKRIQSCCICLSSRSTMLVIPCMHLVLCRTCGGSLTKCPVCMQPISQIREVFQ